MKFKNPFIHGILIKKSLMQTVGLYDEDYYLHKITNYLQIYYQESIKLAH